VIDKVVQREAGAITTFIGTVRELTHGKKTLFLVKEGWPGAKVAITHRIGRLDITEVAVVIAVSTPHRADAFDANRYVIHRIKQIVPIWKKEHWENGKKRICNQLETVRCLTGGLNRILW